jgi:cobalt/nickel transport system permease protein
MQPIHLAIGLIEGFITAGIVLYVKKMRPDIVEDLEGVKVLSSGPSMKKVLAVFAVCAVITGSALSWFASTYPDGLEWSIEKISGSPELPERPSPVTENLTKLQEKTAVLPDYSLPSKEGEEGEASWPSADGGTSLSGLLGSILVLGFIMIFGIAIRTFRPKKKNDF